MAGESERSAFAASLGQPAGVGQQDPGLLHRLSVERSGDFWRQWVLHSGLRVQGDPSRVCVGDRPEAARFFPELSLNFAANLLSGRGAPPERVAVIACHPEDRQTRVTRGELRLRVERLAQALRDRGVGEGDHVAVIPRSDAQAVLAVLAVAAVGACLAVASPEMGAALVAARFGPLQPRVLLAHAGAMVHDSGASLAARVAQVAAELPSLEWLVVLDDALDSLPPLALPVDKLSTLLDATPAEPFAWHDFPFDQPLCITAALGADGRAEALVHSAGGVLLEHTKEHRLHCGLEPGDTLFAPGSVASMMWLWQLGSLASGGAIVLYDGPVRDAATLWRVTQRASATVFVAGAPYLRLGEQAGMAPGREFGLAALRALWYTGTTLDAAAVRWVRSDVKDLPLQALCANPDMLGCLLLEQAAFPLQHEACRSLGLDVRVAFGPDGRVGELICTNPFPSRPLGYVNDVGGERFRARYFSRHPGVWASGERVESLADGVLAQRGRVDSLMSVRGSRVAASEVQAVLREFGEFRETLVVEQQLPAVLGEGRAVLLVVMNDGVTLDGTLIARVRRRLTEAASSTHVPDLMVAVPDLPRTKDGVVCEAAVRDTLHERPLPDLSHLRNPASLNALRTEPALRMPTVPVGPLPPPPAPSWRSRQDHEAYLQALWEQIFGFSPIGLDDDFFELGGHSLLAARIFADIQRCTHQDLAPTTLLKAPTIRQLAGVMDEAAWDLPVPLVQLRPGSGRPFFLVHSLAGTFLELWAVLRALDTQRPVFGFQARGLGAGQEPHVRVADMAREYIGHMRRVQPEGPYAIGGYSFGGLVAYEIAQQLHRAGERVELLGLIDTHVHGRFLPFGQWVQHCLGRVLITFQILSSLPRGHRLAHIRKKLLVLVDRWRVATGLAPRHPDLVGDLVREANFPPALRRVRGAMLVAFREYRPEPYPGRALFLRAAERGESDPLPVWRKVVRGGLDVSITPGNHDEMINGANAKALATALAQHLQSQSP